MVSPKVSLPRLAESPYEGSSTPKPSLQQLQNEDRPDRPADLPPVYEFTPTPAERDLGLNAAQSSGGDALMSGHGRGGTDQARSGGGSNRRQSSQASQRRPTTGYPSLNPPPEAPPGYPSPHYAVGNTQYLPSRGGYSGQYMMSPQPPLNMAHTPPNVFPYPPSFHVQEQPQSIHAGYPTLASYPPYQGDAAQYNPPQSQGSSSPAFPPAFQSYPPPMSPSYPPFSPPSTSFSPPPVMYQHQHQHQHVYPGAPGSYPQYTQHPSPGGAQEGGEGGTWWYVPPARHTPQYDGTPSTYPYYPHAAPLQQPDSGEHSVSSGPAVSPTYARPSTPSSSAPSSLHAGRDRPMVRRSYHPNPPAQRSDWVMWAGNVPSDAGHDELWRFFTQPADGETTPAASSSSTTVDGVSDGGAERGRNGVGSIFLISRSSCAFVNYDTEADLHAAIARFNGVPLRADPRCPRLVCRVRRKDDDLRAGVGGQRGSGMHMRWVKAKQKAGLSADDSGSSMASASEPGTPSSGSHSLETGVSALSLGSGDEDGAPSRPPPRPHVAGSNSSGSHASTNSSLLRQHFPQRYFILKSLTQDDLDKSVHTGVWATQKHNEGILDRAFRTSKDVFLIFSVNKSGEFYGYAQMAGSIGEVDGGRVTWARRDSTSSNASGRNAASKSVPLFIAANNTGDPLQLQDHHILSGDRHVENSPQPFGTPSGTPLRSSPKEVQTAPAELGRPHRNISISSAYPGPSASYDQGVGISQGRDLRLDERAPFRAMRSPTAAETSAGPAADGHSQQRRRESIGSGAHMSELGAVAEEPGNADGVIAEGAGNVDGEQPRDETWGENFKLRWLCTERLPFQRTRQLRNPWNHDREIKVSRDGTELEPSVGQALLEEWQTYLSSGAASSAVERMGPEPGPVAAARSSRGGGGGGASSARS
ncbi:YT521-B-like domain-containing protein [Mycena haematopus]|nr:YT521-B-like domain-containing protein [Mycena haematopus]